MLLFVIQRKRTDCLPWEEKLDQFNQEAPVGRLGKYDFEGFLSQVYCYHKSNISPFYKALIICSLCIGFQFGTCDNNIIMQDFSA